MTGRLSVSARAIVTSTRPGALSILDPGAAVTTETTARYWAEPSKIAEATSLLEEFGFVIIGTDRFGISVSAWQETVEAVFAVKLTQEKTDDGAMVWRAATSGGASLVAIPPVTEAQKSCLRGLVLDKPLAPFMPGPTNSVPDLEKDVFNALGQPAHAYWILPHQLRRQLSATWRSDKELDAIPRGFGVKVAVLDTGWDPRNPYWANVGLGQAASRVTMIRDDKGYTAARNAALGNIAGLSEQLRSIAKELTLHAEQTPRDDIAVSPRERSAGVTSLKEKYRAALDEAQRVLGTAMWKAVKSFLDGTTEASTSHLDLDLLIQQGAQDLSSAAGNIAGQSENLPNQTRPDLTTDPHGTFVVGQLIAVAPEADVTVIQYGGKSNDELFSSAFALHSPYRGLDFASAWDVAMRQKARIINFSWGDHGDFGSNDPKVIEKRSLSVADHDRMFSQPQAKGSVIFVAGGNYEGDLFNNAEPQNEVQVAARTLVRNVITVGGAWWNKPGVSPDDKRVLSASKSTQGYYVGSSGTQISVPDICGLAGPLPETPADGNWGMAIAPVKRGDLDVMMAGSASSYTAPQVAGVGAVVLGARPDLDPVEVIDLLKETAVQIEKGSGFAKPVWGSDVLDLAVGKGRPGLADLGAAFARAAGYQRNPPPAEEEWPEALDDAAWKD